MSTYPRTDLDGGAGYVSEGNGYPDWDAKTRWDIRDMAALLLRAESFKDETKTLQALFDVITRR